MRIRRIHFSIFISLVGVGIIIALVTILNTNGFENYGIATFVTVPFLAGVFATAALNYHITHSWKQSQLAGISVIGISYIVLLIAAFEGAICLLMSAPIAIGLQTLGTFLTYRLIKRIRKPKPYAWAILLLLPFHGMLETRIETPSQVLASSTTDIIKAHPDSVWKQLQGQNHFEPPESWIMKAGISYPLDIEWMEAEGEETARIHCEYSNGSIDLQIDSVVESRYLRFTIDETPHTMKEMSFHDEVHAPHLHGNFTLLHGTFLLEETTDGYTSITTTSTYEHHIKPAAYWKLWSDFAFDQVHGLVIDGLRKNTEQ